MASGIELVNLSKISVTIEEIGFTKSSTKRRSACPYPVLHDVEGCGRANPHRESLTGYLKINDVSPDIERAYATTPMWDNGVVDAVRLSSNSKNI